jgi:hypothetical protein
MNNKLKAALIGGVIVGLPSAIPVLNYCCCIWGIGGGVVAGLLYIKGSQTRVPTGDGAIVGGLAGVVGGVIYLIIGLPIAIFFGAAAIQEAWAKSGVQVPISGTLLMILSGLVAAVCLIVLATLGGLLAIPIFEKRKDDQAPPPPPVEGGMGGNYAA